MTTMSRRSLRTRLVVLSVTLIAGAIATTATIVSLSTTASIQREYRQDIASDASVYDALLGYAAGHPSWAAMTPAQLRKIAAGAGQVTITDQRRHVLAASTTTAASPATQAQPAATVDALVPDPTLSRSPQAGGIDVRAQGPFQLTAAERAAIDSAAAQMVKCLIQSGSTGVSTQRYPNGRTYVTDSGSAIPVVAAGKACNYTLIVAPPQSLTNGTVPYPPPESPSSTVTSRPPESPSTVSNGPRKRSGRPTRRGGTVIDISQVTERLSIPTARELAAARRLTDLFRSCLRTDGQDLPSNYPSLKQVDFLPALIQLPMKAPAETCLATARRIQLASYVAPPALLFISGSVATDPRPSLSSAAITRIILASTAILLIAVVAVLVAASGVSRPLRTLTGAVAGLRGGGHRLRVPASGTKEVAALTDAFNDMSADLAVADQRRKEMISDVAHELRTPLANIRGWLEAAQDGLTRPDPAFIASLLDESRLLQSIIDDLQMLALADAGQLSVDFEPVDLGDVLEQAMSAQHPAATVKQLTLELVGPGDLRIEADPRRLRQAIGNLLANAIRYTDQGSVTVTADGTGPDEILVRIADTGRGISAEDLPHIFDRFWRAEKSRDRRSGGSGLGLAITDRLIAAHGGRIVVQSTLGEGTTVSVHLPRAPD
jgi:two-component system sensor histidine kinase BaeS